MTTQDFSQSGEQALLIAFAERHGPGRFLDIGAGDGETFSNTRALALIGWAGVCIEPAPVLFDRLSALYLDSRVDCVNAAVVPDEGELERFHYVRGDHLSSLKAGHAERWEAPVETMTVRTVGLREILSFFGSFDLVSIDTEGSSLALLEEYSHQGLLWEVLQCVCVEAEDALERGHITRICKDWSWKMTANNMILQR